MNNHKMSLHKYELIIIKEKIRLVVYVRFKKINKNKAEK